MGTFIPMPNPEPLDIVIAAWNGRWDAARLAQCFNNMPVSVAQALLDARTVADAEALLNTPA